MLTFIELTKQTKTRKQINEESSTYTLLMTLLLPVAIVGMFFHVNLAESRLFFVERLFLGVGHRFPLRPFQQQNSESYLRSYFF